MLCCAVSCCAMLCRAMPCGAMLCRPVPSCAVLCRAVPCCAVPCCAVLCRAVLCCAVPCCAVLCRALLCCAVLCYNIVFALVLLNLTCLSVCCFFPKRYIWQHSSTSAKQGHICFKTVNTATGPPQTRIHTGSLVRDRGKLLHSECRLMPSWSVALAASCMSCHPSCSTPCS